MPSDNRTTIRYIETTYESDPDHDAGLPDAELRIGFTHYPAVPEQGPTYASGGQPAEPEFAEFYYVLRMVGGTWIEAPEFNEWAEAWLDNEGQEITCQAVADDEEDARERAAEARAEMRREA